MSHYNKLNFTIIKNIKLNIVILADGFKYLVFSY